MFLQYEIIIKHFNTKTINFLFNYTVISTIQIKFSHNV